MDTEISVLDWLEMVRTYLENGWTEDAYAILDWLYANDYIGVGVLWAYKA